MGPLSQDFWGLILQARVFRENARIGAIGISHYVCVVSCGLWLSLSPDRHCCSSKILGNLTFTPEPKGVSISIRDR